MAKIMFSNRYGLEQGVMDKTKTMTRRFVKCPKRFKSMEDEWCEDLQLEFHKKSGDSVWYDCVVTDGDGRELGQLPLPYEAGEVVAIAQSYHSLNKEGYVAPEHLEHTCESSPGYKNKMFVREDLMPHHILMLDLWFERLQDITDEECLMEGVIKWLDSYIVTGIMERGGKCNKCFDTPREAFAALIDRISGKGTWDSNPWVIAYEFRRID